MIGGTDVRIESGAEPEDALKKAFFLISRIWPNVVVEDATTGDPLSVLFPIEVFAGLKEIMVYQDAAARESWERIGADGSNSNTMIHVIALHDSVTLVVDDPNEARIRQVIQGMRTFLANDIFHIPAQWERQVAA